MSEDTERTMSPGRPARQRPGSANAPASGARPARRRRCRIRSRSAPRPGWCSRSSIVACAFLISAHTPWLAARRPGQHLVPAPARGGADALADRSRQRDQGGRHRLGGHRDRPVGGGADHGLPALAAPAGLPGQPVLPGDRRAVDLLRPVPAAPVRHHDHRQLGRVLGAVSAGRRADDLPHGRGVLPGGAGPPAHLRQDRGGRGHRRVRPGPAVPGRRSPRRRAVRRRARGRDTGHGVPLLHPERGVPGRLPPGPDRSCRCRAAAAARRSGWPCAISSG